MTQSISPITQRIVSIKRGDACRAIVETFLFFFVSMERGSNPMLSLNGCREIGTAR